MQLQTELKITIITAELQPGLGSHFMKDFDKYSDL